MDSDIDSSSPPKKPHTRKNVGLATFLPCLSTNNYHLHARVRVGVYKERKRILEVAGKTNSERGKTHTPWFYYSNKDTLFYNTHNTLRHNNVKHKSLCFRRLRKVPGYLGTWVPALNN